MDKLDSIIDRFAMPKIIVVQNHLFFRCEQDAYYIIHNSSTKDTIYIFDSNHQRVKTTISEKQLKYYVDSGYWVSIKSVPQIP